MNPLLRAQKLPSTWVATLVDSRGTVIARTDQADRFVGKSGTPDLLARLARSDEGVAESITLDGREALMAYSRAPESRWAVIVAMPRSELTAAARGAFGWAALSGLTLLALGMLVAAWVAEGWCAPSRPWPPTPAPWAAGSPCSAPPLASARPTRSARRSPAPPRPWANGKRSCGG
jgi:hypothetical protein